MKNKLPDLTDHLFAQMERLGDESLTDEQLEQEVKRAHAVVSVSDQIIGVAKVRLAAAKLGADYGHEVQDVVYPMIEKKVGP
ncbi:hypothetical protein [Aliiroseovarius lamellibrachiae]|uniref:hypothetical protein n=1 Tax=Aliiroseovarius lamellibrachiae TaxID=1924933 RepID=UPI001BE09E3C|nr:hypothetical protein [Aliiroseovarius lamellibrachiae]MBT2131205.1 hypothetical protein [Aliiroseovarius lamellibrachiae]